MKPLLLAFLAVAPFPLVSSAQSSSSTPKSETVNASKSEAAKQQSSAQDLSARVPAPKPDDVKSLDSILKAIYDVICGPAGDRDWNRFRSLFVPEARLTSATRKANGPFAFSMSKDTLAAQAVTSKRTLSTKVPSSTVSKHSATSPRFSAATNPATPPTKSPSPAASTAFSF